MVRVLDIAGGVMEELASPSGPRKDFVNSHCREFMQSIKVDYSSSSLHLPFSPYRES